jgi:hypothetical protein
LAGLPAWAFALGFMLLARERSGLAFAGPFGVGQTGLQIGHLLLQFGNPRQRLAQLRLQIGKTLIAWVNRGWIVRHMQQDSSIAGVCQLPDGAIDQRADKCFGRQTSTGELIKALYIHYVAGGP